MITSSSSGSSSSSGNSSSSSSSGDSFPQMIGAAISGTPSALGRHQHLMSIYSTSNLSDNAVLERHHQFLRNDEDDAQSNTKEDWGLRMARKYYSKLFKEYAIADLSMHASGRIGLRWRTEKEVIAGKGQFSCASKRCESMHNLHSYEVPFDYVEQGVAKNELVKVRVCINCARMLFHEKLKSMRKDRKTKRKEGRDESYELSKPETTVCSHDEILEILFKSPNSTDIKDSQGCRQEDREDEQRKERRRMG